MSLKTPFYHYKHSEWDTAFFGVTSAKLTLADVSQADAILESLQEDLSKAQFTVISNLNNEHEVNRLLGEYTAAFLVDMNVQFEKKAQLLQPIDKEIVVTSGRAFSEELLSLAEGTFKYSRFFNDPYLEADKARGIYGQWVKSAFDNQHKTFVEYYHTGKLVGFLLFSVSEAIYTIELIAVDQHYSGRGIGGSLLRAFEQQAASENEEALLRVGTQLANKEAIAFYTKNGFRYKACSSIYHHWNH